MVVRQLVVRGTFLNDDAESASDGAGPQPFEGADSRRDRETKAILRECRRLIAEALREERER